MTTVERELAALMKLMSAQQESERQAARREMEAILNAGRPQACRTPEPIIRKILIDLGVPDHLRGHAYAVEAILLTVEDRAYIRSVTFGLYPQVAAKFNTTAARVERSIRYLIDVTWAYGDLDQQMRYFGGISRSQQGKPTNAAFIARIANEVLMQMGQAA